MSADAARQRNTPRRRRPGSFALALRVLRVLRPYAYGCRRQVVTATSLSALYLFARLAQPWPLKWVIDAMTSHHKHHRHDFTLLALSYVVLSALAGLADYGQRRLLANLANRVVYRFRYDLFAHVLSLPLAYQERRGAGEMLTRVVWDTARLRRGVSGILLRLLQSTALFAATVGVLAWLSPLLAGVVLACGVVAFLSMRSANRKIIGSARVSRRREGKLASVVEENVRGARDLQTYGTTGDRRFDAANARSLRSEQTLVKHEAALLLRIEVLLAVLVCVILWLGSREVRAGGLTTGQLVLFVHYALGLYRPFTQFARQTAQTGRTAACAERLLRIASRKPAVADGDVVAPPLQGEIVFEDVRVRASQRARGGRAWVLKGASFRIQPGERVAVLGHNGAGKSTVFRHLLRLTDPRSGRILVDGRDLREYTIDSLRSQFSVVHQNPSLFGLTVRENVALGKPDASDEEILRAIDAAGAGPFVRRLPKKLDTVVRGARIFSAGERQRLALARAILRNGRVWLLDEPTTAINKPEVLEQALLAACRGRTVLWATHDVEIARRMDRVLILADGVVEYFGPPDDLPTSPSLDGDHALDTHHRVTA